MLSKDQDFKSVILTDENGEKFRFTAIFHQDKGFLSWNRLTFIGDRNTGIDLLRLSRGLVRFRLIEPDGTVGQGYTLSGEGFETIAGTSRSGPGLDDKSIYDVG